MKPRQKKFAFIVAGVAGLGIAVGIVLYALRGNVSLYFTPTQVFEKQAPIGFPCTIAMHFRMSSDGNPMARELLDVHHPRPMDQLAGMAGKLGSGRTAEIPKTRNSLGVQ